jgi:serine/threonine-protein kinase
MNRPERLGKYQITGVLGNGAMGVVYTGFDSGIRRPVAIKTIHKKLIDDPAQAQLMAARFQNEAQAVGRLLHPGIVAIYEYGEDENVSFIVMELVRGQSLAKVLASQSLPESDVLKLMDQLLDALSFAHRHGVLHRDIKPANLILAADGVLKVTDFGIARIENNALTQVNLVIGTPGYMAPEQYAGDSIDQRVDVFSAGVLLYRMLTGEAPFSGTYEQVMYKILNEEPVPPSRLPGGESLAPYDAIVVKALAKDRNQRYQSAGELRGALAKIARAMGVEGTTVAVRPDPTSMPRATHEPSSHGSAARSLPSGSSGSGGTQLTPVDGWDIGTLSTVERTLASYIGPLARMLVRQSAKRTVDMGTLASMLAVHIDTASDRQAFTRRVEALSLTGGSGSAPGKKPPDSVLPSAAPGKLSDATIEHALKMLPRRIGPIAKLIVRKASAQATSREHFFQLLADLGPADIDRGSLIAELQRGP